MSDRIASGLQYLSEQFSVERAEFHRDQHPGGPMLLEGLVSRGFVNTKGDRYAVSDAGRRRMAEADRGGE